jgi:hypothetical protein
MESSADLTPEDGAKLVEKLGEFRFKEQIEEWLAERS